MLEKGTVEQRRESEHSDFNPHEDSTESSELHTGLLAQMLVTWLTPLLYLGYRRPLEAADLLPLGLNFKAAYLYEVIRRKWALRKASINSNRWVLLRACCDAFGGAFYAAGVLKFIGDVCGLSSPVVLGLIIADLKRPERNLATGIGLCLLIFVLQMINTITVNSYFTITAQTGLKVRTSMSALVYHKALRLDARARQAFSTGQIVNLMSTDSSRLDMATTYIHYIWSGPFQVIVIVILLFRLLSWASLVGFGFLLLFIPLQSHITTKLSKYRKETSSITDKRVRLMQEIIQGIRVIKFYAWEESFLAKLFELRGQELLRVKKTQTIRSLMVVLTSVTSIFACILAFVTFHLMGNRLTAEIVFPTLALFNLLRLPLMLLPMVIGMVVDGAVALKRLQKFLLADELDFSPEFCPESKWSVVVDNGSFVWDTNHLDEAKDVRTSKMNLLIQDEVPPAGPFVLKDIDLKVVKGSLVGIIGPVGAGKSSLLNALVGELKVLEGKVIFSGSVAYCPQQAWIQNATVRENIIFGAAFNQERYDSVVAACALLPDFSMLPDGDSTEIGEKGVNLSGGQKQRISLARAAYANVEIVLLDDPLSAVDAHVGKHILSQCINGIMADRTRLLVTHQLQVLPGVDYVFVMENGRIVEQGEFDDLIMQGGDFANLMRIHGGIKHDDNNNGAFATISNLDPPGSSSEQKDCLLESIIRLDEESSVPTDSEDTRLPSPTVLTKQAIDTLADAKIVEAIDKVHSQRETKQKITATEERVVGAVKWAIYRDYLLAAGGLSFVLTAFFSVISWNLTRIATDYWVANWTSVNPIVSTSAKVFIIAYLILGILQGAFAIISSLSFSWGGIKAARILHEKSAKNILLSPVAFFDTNPTGRIISRFSKDQDTLDSLMPETLRSFVHTLGLTMFTFLAMIFVNWIFSVPLLLILVLYYLVQMFYRRTSRELKRLEALSRSPLYAHFSESLTGLPTIRAFAQQRRFAAQSLTLLDINNRAAFMQLSIQRWLGIRLESVGNLIILAAAVCCYSLGVEPSLAGLVISYSLSITGVMNWCIRQFADTETQIIASERLSYYANKLTLEAPHELSHSVTSDNWPTRGAIAFSHLTMCYRPDLPPVLHNVSLSINAGERIGIVGRTGAGKSSIMLALFRIVEATEGSISIDGVNIAALGLSQLRSRISIIPQDPVVFAASVRWNLDPNSLHTDQELWMALERAHLREAIIKMEGGLDANLHEGGENLSVGQRQLLCLARAILGKNRLLVLDEATANVDLATDALIQASIRKDFANCTVLTIAHRISTVIDYDRILVLERGHVVEFDTPNNLLNLPNSLFSALVRETGEQSEAVLRSMVKI